jgi:hypothetical protein
MSSASRLAAAVVCSSLFAVPVALAQSAPPGAGAQPCRADVARLCPEAKDRASIRACMKDKADQVSAECKAKWADFKERAQAVIEACKPDAAKLCSQVRPGHGRVMVCLRDHEAELSDACRAQLPPPPPAAQQ